MRTELSGGSLFENDWIGVKFSLYARSRWDANLVDGIATLRLSGNHTSEPGRAGADRLREETQLIRVRARTNSRSIGLTVSQSVFSQILKVDGIQSRIYRHIGVDGAVTLGSSRLFGEAVASRASDPLQHLGSALIAGWRLNGGWLRLQVQMRSLSPDYVAIRSAPSSAYGVSNERGIGVSAELRSSGKRRIEAFIDRHGSLTRPSTCPYGGSVIDLESPCIISSGRPCRPIFESRPFWNDPPNWRRRTDSAEASDFGSRSRPNTARSASGENTCAGGIERRAKPSRSADLRVSSAPVRLDLWLTHSRRSGSGTRIYSFRPEVWGGRSVISLPVDGHAASARLTASQGPLEITAVYHAAPARRLALQVDLTR